MSDEMDEWKPLEDVLITSLLMELQCREEFFLIPDFFSKGRISTSSQFSSVCYVLFFQKSKIKIKIH